MPTKEKANEDDFDWEWKECETFEEAKSHAPRSRISKDDINEGGFYESSGAGKKQVLTLSAIRALQSGKKTANMPWENLKVGKTASRLYICYKNIHDPTSVVFFVRTLTRVK